MKRVMILQARMGSSRLPGKVMKDVAGKPMMAQQLRRLKNCCRVDEMVVATTTHPMDDPVVTQADLEQVRWFRGSEHDVLLRYVEAAREARADVIIRVTADCPLIDAEETDRVIAELEDRAGHVDYAANIVTRTFPKGLDTEAMFRDTLERIHRLGHSQPSREHVTAFLLREQPELFRMHSVTDSENHSHLRWTVDTAEDLEYVRRVYTQLELDQQMLGYRDMLTALAQHPSLLRS